MEDGEPVCRDLTPTSAIPELAEATGLLLKDSQADAPGPEAPETPSDEGAAGRRAPQTLAKSGELSSCSAKTEPSSPDDVSADEDTPQDVPAAPQETSGTHQDIPAASQETPGTSTQVTSGAYQDRLEALQTSGALSQEIPEASNQQIPGANQEVPESSEKMPVASNEEPPGAHQEVPEPHQELPRVSKQEAPKRDQEVPVASDQVKMPAHLELWVRQAPGENLDLMPLPSARVRTWETGLLDWGAIQEEASLGSSTETTRTQEEAPGQLVQARCLPAQEAPEQAAQAMRVWEPEEEQAPGKRQAPEQGQENRLEAGELGGLAQEKPGILAQGLRGLQGPEQNGMYALPKRVPGAQEAQGLDATWELCPSITGLSQQKPLASPLVPVLPLRSNSFPGPHHTEHPRDLARSLSFSHWEPPKRPPKPATWGILTPQQGWRSGQDAGSVLHSNGASPLLGQSLGLPPTQSEGPGTAHSWPNEHNSTHTSHPVAVDGRFQEPPPPLERKHGQVPTRQRHSHPAPVAPCLRKGPPDHLTARQLRPLPATPDSPRAVQASLFPRARYNKPLPPTPNVPQLLPSAHSPRSLRTYKPLPPLPTLDAATEPPPLPPKLRGRSRSTQGSLARTPGQATPGGPEWSAPLGPSAGRTSWPPATSQSVDPLVTASRSRGEGPLTLAFSNVTNLLSPLSPPTMAWPPEDRARLTGESGPPAGAPARREGSQEGPSNLRRSQLDHPPLEKASSWPHRREQGRPLPGYGTPAPGEGPNSKSKGWNRQGLRRPSVLPDGTADPRTPAMDRPPGPSDPIILREKRPKEAATGGFSRRCSKLINSSQLLYQEYSDEFLNKEIQSQQRLDSLGEAPGQASPRLPRRALVSSESYLKRLSSASSSSLWQEIPVVRNSAVLLSMTHEDQKLQEAKFELIVSEASYLRSLHVAVDHFQLSTALRATLTNQEHQWLFSRLQDVCEVSTTFLSDLEENFENNIFTFHVCDVVLSHAPHFRRVYLPYVTNQKYQERTFQSLLSRNSQFREVLEKLESDAVCQRLSLKSFLILPFQRITRLKLLLQNILKRTQPGSEEEAEATKAHHALEELIWDCNSNAQRMRRTEELIYLSQRIAFECRIFPLISQSRWLVKSGELTALDFGVTPGPRRKLNTRPVHLHLFNDCLLLSRPREGGRFLVFDHAPFSEVRGEKCEMKLHGAHKNLFRLFLRHGLQDAQDLHGPLGPQAEFLFSTETQSEKLRWISALASPREELDLLECLDAPQVQCLRTYKPRENDELALEKADVVMVTQQSSDGWLEGVRLSDGERGWFPIKQVDFIRSPEVRARNLQEAHRVKIARLQLVEQT
ncbi:rho guanine nucleotide exchange factor 5 [Tenrec ecaudatus]|uniref:rho guanine nucleotide exchange factor 5 n=1 Tax=Tenrec ecaudatus TaxID=94439 RepID=UPI003F5AD067